MAIKFRWLLGVALLAMTAAFASGNLTGTEIDHGDNDSSAIVYLGDDKEKWLLIKNNNSPVHGYVLSFDLATEVSNFEFPDPSSGVNIDSEGVAVTKANYNDLFYVITELTAGNTYVFEYAVSDALAGDQTMTPTNTWQLNDIHYTPCNVANSNNEWEGLAFVPDEELSQPYYEDMPKGYFIALCQGNSTYYTFRLDIEPTSPFTRTVEWITTNATAPCSFNSSDGCGIDYDWDDNVLLWSSSNDLLMTSTSYSCLDSWTFTDTNDAEGVGVMKEYLAIADDAEEDAGVIRYTKPY